MTNAWRDKETLQKLYHKKGMSLREIGDELGCSYNAVQTWMQKHDIERRDMRDVAGNHKRKKPAHYRTNHYGYEEWKTVVDDKQETVSVHRLVAVAEYGFPDIDDWVVHHENGIPWDNRETNLRIMTDSEHKRTHAKERWQNEEYRQKQKRRAQSRERRQGRFI
jgi:DNA-directed RNA polymerase specialized sigma subunit